jgi:hypothetical protein
MSGYEVSLHDFAYLIKVISRHHAKMIGSWVGLTAHTRKGSIYFRDSKMNEVSLDEVYRACQGSTQIQRWIHNMLMGYSR